MTLLQNSRTGLLGFGVVMLGTADEQRAIGLVRGLRLFWVNNMGFAEARLITFCLLSICVLAVDPKIFYG